MNEGHKYDVKDHAGSFCPSRSGKLPRAAGPAEAGCARRSFWQRTFCFTAASPAGPRGQGASCCSARAWTIWAVPGPRWKGFLAGETDYGQGAVFCLFDNEGGGQRYPPGRLQQLFAGYSARAGAALGKAVKAPAGAGKKACCSVPTTHMPLTRILPRWATQPIRCARTAAWC